jgi:hypothetical protein
MANGDAGVDQENPQTVVRTDGTAAITWQSGVRGHQNVKIRFVSSGTLSAGEVAVAGGATANEKGSSLTFLSDGNVLVTWTAEDTSLPSGSDNPTAILGQKFDLSGNKIGGQIQISTANLSLPSPQRASHVVALADGGFACAWISEQERHATSTDVILGLFDASGTQVGGTRVNNSKMNCDAPRLAVLDGGKIAIVWTQIDPTTTSDWTIAGRVFNTSSIPFGNEFTANLTAVGSQLAPQIAASGTEALIVWRSAGADKSAPSILARTLNSDGTPSGSEINLSAANKGNKFLPSVVATPTGDYLATWSSYSGLAAGNDVYAQRLGRAAQPLSAPSAPFVYAQSSARLVVSWPAVMGQAVDHYEVFIDQSGTATTTTSLSILSDSLPAATVHSAAVRYVLTDGRVSPLSALGTGSTWGEDANFDGLPDDWEAEHFGQDSSKWPSPDADSDHDGVSNRQEFLAGTDPMSAASVLKMRLATAGGVTSLEWNSVVGRSYQLYMSQDLQAWAPVGGAALSVSSTVSVPLDFNTQGTYFRVNLIR